MCLYPRGKGRAPRRRLSSCRGLITLWGRVFRRGKRLICPACQSTDCRRSRRSGISDRLLGAARLMPWKCRECSHRFHSWTVRPKIVLHAHCPRCGNLAVERVARKRVEEGFLAGLQRMLRFPAYRCDPCRHKFFSLRPYRQVPRTLAGAEADSRDATASTASAHPGGGAAPTS